MKKLIGHTGFAALLAAFMSAAAWAGTFNPLNQFKNNLGDGFMKPFAEDLGGILGGADFSSGRTLGFPGLDVGAVGMIQTKPNADDRILKNAGVKAFGLGLLQASVALPLVGADVTARGVNYSGLTIAGGGLRFPLLRSGTLTKFLPDISVAAFYDAVNYKYFTARHVSADISASFDIPIIKPYFGAGYDRTKVTVKGVPGPFDGIHAIAAGARYTAGLKIIPFPFVYVFGAYSLLDEEHGYNVGAGIKF